ncbi:S8 family peptidase [Tsuneonella troitsensis]|uniref:S8 family peptidase n=1 Tax=Tsuneonella troitsensis TaxID=292222 RepID=UPI00070CFE3C|nr:S8 family serine peptidase [Tsuneonella troitsensis]
MLLRLAAVAALIGVSLQSTSEAYASDNSEFWASRSVTIPAEPPVPAVRIGVWDSGVDLSLFEGRIATDSDGNPLVRGYDEFKQRQDSPMAVLPPELQGRQDELNKDLAAFDDIDSGVESPSASEMKARLGAMSKEEEAEFTNDLGRWAGYTHGTSVADIALRDHGRAELIVARMEWWHGSPPVPCWTRELADLEAASVRDLLQFLVGNGARIVNMSWGRFETSYIKNLEECAPNMPEGERKSLARYTVERIRAELQSGMAAAPDVLFVGAAGNSGSPLVTENPATRFTLPNFILVGAVDATGALADYSNQGSEVSLYANGDRVPARLPGGLLSFATGTSMATPNVANAAAKMLAVNPRLTGAELKSLMLETSDTNKTGQRLLHPRRAVEAARTIRD